jgi:hypothetical protein
MKVSSLEGGSSGALIVVDWFEVGEASPRGETLGESVEAKGS